jgi:hypothetical protein
MGAWSAELCDAAHADKVQLAIDRGLARRGG